MPTIRRAPAVRFAACILAAFAAIPAPAPAALQAPVLPAAPEETLLAIGDGLVSHVALDSRGQPHVVHGGRFSNNLPLRHAWFDGFTWRVRTLADERTLALDTVRVGEVLHIAALFLDPAGGPDRLEYLRVDLATQAVNRRPIATGAQPDFHIAIDRTGARVGIVYRVASSTFIVEGLPEGPNQFTLLTGSGRVYDLLHVPGEGIAVIYRNNPQAGGVEELRVLRSGPGGETNEQVVDFPIGRGVDAQLATDDAGDLVYVAAFDGSVLFAEKRLGPDNWRCSEGFGNQEVFYVPCASNLVPSYAGRGLALDSDAGSSTIRGWMRARGAGTEERFIQGFAFPRNSRNFELFAPLPVDRPDPDGTDLEFVQFAGVGSRFGTLLRDDRLYGVRDAAPWRSRIITDVPAATGAVALAVDPAGVPVVVADYGASAGLRASEWIESQQRLSTAGLRPPTERYAEAAAAFADSGTLYVAARATPQNDLVVIQRAPGSFTTTRSVLASANDTGHAPQVAAVDGRVAVAWLDLTFGQVRYAERAGDSGSFAFEVALPVSVDLAASPRLALSRSGLAYVSLFDAATGTLRVFSRSDGAFALYDTITGPGIQPVHALAATANGRPALLYGVRQADDRILMRYRYDLQGQTVDQSTQFTLSAGADLAAAQLALHRDAPTDARALVAARDGAIEVHFGERIAAAPEAAFAFQSLGTLTEAELAAGLALAAPGRTYITGGDARSVLEVRRIEGRAPPVTQEILEPVTTPEPTYLAYNSQRGVLAQCICLFIACPLPPASRGASDGAPDLSTALRARFATTPEGRYYLGLYERHGGEMAGLLLAQPDLLGERMLAFQQFMPVLAAFADGRGGSVVMTAPMLERARAFWQRWSDAGSPALRATIETELARTDGLRDFIGLTADQWFAALPGAPPLFADGFE
jgi:hypothetical protein